MKTAILIFSALMQGILTVHADDVSLTVYNSDLAVVSVSKEMKFNRGLQTISFTDVAEMIDPTSVRFTAEKAEFRMIEQNYRYDLVNSAKILKRYIDHTISVWLKEGEFIEGTLQSAAGDVVVQGRDGKLNIIRSNAIERFEFPELPDGLITRPTLVWKMDSKMNTSVKADISYMTGGLSWHAEYTAVVSDDDSALELSSWVSIDNNSGATYEDAALKLVAGDVHRVTPPSPRLRMLMQEKTAADAAPSGFEERGLFEYHLYALKDKTTIRNAEIKQITLFEPVAARIDKRFIFNSRIDPNKVAVNVEFTNSEDDGPGIPLPAGKVRVFKKDVDGSLEFAGEDAIDHTPRNEKVRLNLGNAFDLVGERQLTDSKRVSERIREETVEIKLRNRKEEAVNITAVEHIRGDWQILTQSHEYVKKDASTVEFTVDVPSDSEVVINYTVRLK